MIRTKPVMMNRQFLRRIVFASSGEQSVWSRTFVDFNLLICAPLLFCGWLFIEEKLYGFLKPSLEIAGKDLPIRLVFNELIQTLGRKYY
jgi:hypothetical protein